MIEGIQAMDHFIDLLALALGAAGAFGWWNLRARSTPGATEQTNRWPDDPVASAGPAR
jgi:hypothetical protein